MEKFGTAKGLWGAMKVGFSAALPAITSIGAHLAANALAPGIGSAVVLAA